MSKRIERVNSLLQQELSQILLREIDIAPNVLVTITRVYASDDLEEARVYISVLPASQLQRVFQILNRNIYDFQQKLNGRLNMRPVPRIKFVKEEKVNEVGRVEEILEVLKNEKK